MKEELDLAGDDTKVFKLIGPALVNQDLTEAKGNVEKRIEYIRYTGSVMQFSFRHACACVTIFYHTILREEKARRSI